MSASMACRPGCGACCIAPSISSPLPGMPGGKAAGERCLHLTEDLRCELFGYPDRPTVCSSFRPDESVCGTDRAMALRLLGELERCTVPSSRPLIWQRSQRG